MNSVGSCYICRQELYQLEYLLIGPQSRGQRRKLAHICTECIHKTVYCEYCSSYPIAVIFSPPDKDEFVNELYLCETCYKINQDLK
ncbi:MAG: hypothetical protein ACFFG0_37845 [Candidatus Thorarchaeota archaeon]